LAQSKLLAHICQTSFRAVALKYKALGKKSLAVSSINQILITTVKMSKQNEESQEIQQISELQPNHFADLMRAAQLIFDPTGGVSGRYIEVDWEAFGVPLDVVENLKLLGEKYRYASPYTSIENIWSQLTPTTRLWFIDNKDYLWVFEEAFPALDED
jgi:hypothetical protein